MKRFCIIFLVFLSVATLSTTYSQISYTVPSTPWPEAFGNHRAVIEVAKPSEVVTLDLFWRRHDPDPQKRRFIIVNAATGDTVKNIYRYSVTRERCFIAFGPVKTPGTYYFYYLPYHVQEEWGFYGTDYPGPEKTLTASWVNGNKVGDMTRIKSFQTAGVTEIQSRSAFDSFWPMEIIPLVSEKKALLTKYKQEYLIFPEDRSFPVRMKDEIPKKWIDAGPSDKFAGEACRNEYYALQLAVYASKSSVSNVRLEFTPLSGAAYTIPQAALTCFNTGGTDPYGEPFTKRVDVPAGMVQPFWVGIDIGENVPAGVYSGEVTFKAENMTDRKVQLSITVNDKVLSDRGDSEPWRHSRLRWLNSTLGIGYNNVKPYDAIRFAGNNAYKLTNKFFTRGTNGFPESISVDGTEILAGSFSFIAETDVGAEEFSLPEQAVLIRNEPGVIGGSWKSFSGNFEMSGTGIIEADGYFNYKINLKAKTDVVVKDIRLEIPFNPAVAQYIMGMGLPGKLLTENYHGGWNGPFDSFWLGNTKGGLWCELRGGEYHGPLLNLYKPPYPASWYNEGKGGFKVSKEPNATRAMAFSGSRSFSAGDSISFEWSFLITPVKKLDTQSQFTNRYYHNGGNPMPSDEDLSCGVRVVNLHHANNYNPHINYPFIAVDSMKWFVNQLHAKNQKVKIYYTIRELTNYATEIWALRSLGDEILGDGNGGGYMWLREHFITGYHPQWYQYFPDKSPDASVVSAPGASRWYNYYIEGLAWLVKNVDIDGLYLDDVTYDRRTVKRIRKVLDGLKPGCMLDLHSNTGFSKGPANQYAEYFPYVDKLWFGESFKYDEMPPENWLVETSGIPFGLMGDMLQGGGNRWRGMVYGMTLRLPWVTESIPCDPRPVWKVWDEFGIENSEMKGYWDKDCPVRTDREDVKATIYMKDNSALVAAASWAGEQVNFRLLIDWKLLGMDKANTILYAPYIKDFQEERTFSADEAIPVEPKKGWLIYLKPR